MNEGYINFSTSNVYLNDSDSEKNDYYMENHIFFEQLPFLKNSYVTDNLDDKLNNEMLNI